ncbi:GNAT family N-acetyltransferase [Paenibacillus donghaensis]|uniref:N-acetyltransferase domain-containing protein n=1 Tax=Paenibacillus donghaensis TaxID=414771 RepID=A0A2Z2KMZ6_9BACL|nr:GNAT family N-acetyltransferase [Paenibacillus donghaensis]ASA22532.1 hypothetical protein B9T62_18140 [Paenibacillus donghaensis]
MGKAVKEEIVAEDFHNCIRSGGCVIAAELNGKIIAFAALPRELFGSKSLYADLMQLHVSSEHRKYGLGRKLFAMSAAQAARWGADKLYISAHSAKETQAFYRSVGCVDAVEINKHHVELEPYDVQLEYVIANSKMNKRN